MAVSSDFSKNCTVVWFKRDLRCADHAPLAHAATIQVAQRASALALFVIEDEWLTSSECDAQHVAFTLACLAQLKQSLASKGLHLLVMRGAMPAVLSRLHEQYPFAHLLSHEETGPGWTYARDIRVADWCKHHQVQWQEWPQTGVIRRLKDRRGWAARWHQRMADEPIAVPTFQIISLNESLAALDASRHSNLGALRELVPTLIDSAKVKAIPSAGERAAQQTLDDFLSFRGREYRSSISSPLTAQQGCSRLSAHLAFGTLSMRQVHQATEARIRELNAVSDLDERAAAKRFAYHLRGFASRLRWHCHFMQKLEDEPAIEFRNFSRASDGLREDHFNSEYFEAWREGRTGFPMIDACMRSLNATGWLNFRMRAMLVSFASYHLWLHWRQTGQHLARQFLDFEAGIHWSQMQMQSGTTGINTLRIYSPAKQQVDHDATGEFVRQWIPEYGTTAYPKPIIDEKAALKAAKDRLYGLRKTDAARSEADAIQRKHGSRKSGLPNSASRLAQQRSARHAANEKTEASQLSLFD